MELITKISSITTIQNYIALRLYLLPSFCLNIAPSIIEIRLNYCKDKQLAEQSNNLCIGCFNEIVKFYAGQGNAQDHYLETLLMGLKPEPLEKLYNKARYMSHLDYCQKIIQFYEKGREDGQSRGQTTKNRLPGDSRTNTERRRSGAYLRRDEKHLVRNQTQKRDFIQTHYQN